MSGSSGLIGDRWFLVLDSDYASSVDSSSVPTTIQSCADVLARHYQQKSNRHSKSFGLGEVWSILNPFSIIQFLRFSMADVFWMLCWLIDFFNWVLQGQIVRPVCSPPSGCAQVYRFACKFLEHVLMRSPDCRLSHVDAIPEKDLALQFGIDNFAWFVAIRWLSWLLAQGLNPEVLGCGVLLSLVLSTSGGRFSPKRLSIHRERM